MSQGQLHFVHQVLLLSISERLCGARQPQLLRLSDAASPSLVGWDDRHRRMLPARGIHSSRGQAALTIMDNLPHRRYHPDTL